MVKPKNKDDIKPRIPLPFMDGILAINFNYWDKEKLLRSLADVPDTPTPRSLPVSHPRFPTNIIFRARPEPNQNQFPVRLKVHPPFLSASTRSPATPPSRDSPLPTPITPSFPGAWRSPSTFAPAAGGVSAIKP